MDGMRGQGRVSHRGLKRREAEGKAGEFLTELLRSAARIFGCVRGFVVVYLLGFASVNLAQKILGVRVSLDAEASGLDLSEVGALGYRGGC